MTRSQTVASGAKIIPYLWRTPLLWIGALVLLPGLVFATLGIALAIQDARFAAGGANAVGTVLSKDLKPASQRSGTSYSVRYRFTASNHHIYEGSSTIDVHDWERLVEGGPIAVQYLASDPSSSRLSSAGNVIFEAGFIFIGLTCVLIGGYLVVRSSRTLIEDWRLLRIGIEVPARVEAVEATNLRINRRVQWEISYSYRDASGKEYEGRSWTMSEAAARKFSPGDRGTLRYDPRRPAQSLWIHIRPLERQGSADSTPATPAG